MSVLSEVRRAYNERTRQLDFKASKYIRASGLAKILAAVGRYNEFRPADVANAIRLVDSKALVLVGRESSPVLYIKTMKSKIPLMKVALNGVKADEITVSKGEIRAWWD